MSFYKQSTAARLATPNESEIRFDEMAASGLMPSAAPWGIDHPPIDVPGLPPIIRYAPDRITSKSFYECKGVGKDGIIKVKLEQLYGLQFWATLLPVKLFIWDSYRKRWTTLSLADFMKTCERNGVLQQFPDNNKPAWFMHVDFLDEAGWVDAT